MEHMESRMQHQIEGALLAEIEQRRTQVLKITLQDRGQDFTEWYVRDGYVIDCQPFQARVWVGTKLVDKRGVEPFPGMILTVITRDTRRVMDLVCPVESVEVLGDEEAAKAIKAGGAWANIIRITLAELGLEA